MPKTLFLVYQDCYKCDGRKVWFEDQQEFAKKHHIEIEPVSYLTKEGKELILAATEAKFPSMPFYTDGKSFGASLRSFVLKDGKRRSKKEEVMDEPEKETEGTSSDSQE